jgi:hypothetical protein
MMLPFPYQKNHETSADNGNNPTDLQEVAGLFAAISTMMSLFDHLIRSYIHETVR